MFSLLTAVNSSIESNDTVLDFFNATDFNPINISHRLIADDDVIRLEHPSTDFATVARRELRWVLILHTYGFACLFFILAFYTFFSILNLRSLISSRPFMSTINGFLCLLGASRSACLFIDPYNFKETMPRVFGQILWDLGFPGIISAFCLVQLAFLQLTQLKLGAEVLRRKAFLSLIITAHFSLTVAMDIAVAVHQHIILMKVIVQYVFLSWGVILCCNFLYSGYKVMLLIRKIPGGFHRDLPDPNHKGIMQLAMLAPYNNLAGSVTAALLPTLCAPKIHHQDIATSSLGFRNDPNSRILESESIPILEEVAGSSGDERSPLPLGRASSLQNSTRGLHRNLKPKLSLQAQISGEEIPPSSPRSPGRNDVFGFPARNFTKPPGILKGTEAFVTTKDIHEFKSKIHSRTGFENESYRGGLLGVTPKVKEESLLPNITVSCPSNRSSTEDVQQVQPEAKLSTENENAQKREEALNEVINQIQLDLQEMNMERGEDRRSRKHSSLSRKSSGEGSGRRNNRRDRLSVDAPNSRRSSGCSAISDTGEGDDSDRSSRDRRRNKSLSWRSKRKDEEASVQDCLLPQEPQGGDMSLSVILNHIAYVNRAAASADGASQDLEKAGRSQVEWVLNVTYVTAMWGLMLCLTTMSQVQMYGMGDQESPRSSAVPPLYSAGLFSSPWPWLWFQTFCRALELAMGCAIANITRQPTANSRYPHTLRLRHRDTF